MAGSDFPHGVFQVDGMNRAGEGAIYMIGKERGAAQISPYHRTEAVPRDTVTADADKNRSAGEGGTVSHKGGELPGKLMGSRGSFSINIADFRRTNGFHKWNLPVNFCIFTVQCIRKLEKVYREAGADFVERNRGFEPLF